MDLTSSLNPQKSLRSTLYLWFLAISLLPLLVFTFYSLNKFEGVITQELLTRIQSQFLSIQSELAALEKSLLNGVARHAADRSITRYAQNSDLEKLKNAGELILQEYITDRMSFYSLDGKNILNIFASNQKNIPTELSADLLKKIQSGEPLGVKEATLGSGIAYRAFSVIKTASPNTNLILEEVVELDQNYAQLVKKETNLDVLILDSNFHILNSSFVKKPASFKYLKKIALDSNQSKIEGITHTYEFETSHQVYMALLHPIITLDGKEAYVGVVTSKEIFYHTLLRIQTHMLIFAAILLLLLLGTVIFASGSIVNPIKILVEATSQLKAGKFKHISRKASHELGSLTESFNDMAESIESMKKQLEDKVVELESTNKELKDTQARLVHSAKMVSLGKLVAGVAHELNNPIAAIYSNMQHLGDYVDDLQEVLKIYKGLIKKLPEKDQKKISDLEKEKDIGFILQDAHKIVESTIEGTQRTKGIVLGLRNFSRLDEAERKTVDIHEGLESTLQLLHNILKNNITVHKKYADLPSISCYPSELNQVFMNLLTNAAQAIEKKGDIWITTKHEEDQILIEIEDSGCGIEKEHLEHIFDPFFTTKDVGSGTGLGLSITYNIIKKHKGEISAKSEKGKGTKFTILLPAPKRKKAAA